MLPMLLLYAAWLILSLAAFRLAEERRAIWLVLIGGYIFLPPGNYPAEGDPLVFPFWIIGGGLPSDVWLAKSWIAPLVTLALCLGLTPQRFRDLRPHWADGLMLVACLWPMMQAILIHGEFPEAVFSSLWLAGCWGAPWLLGRVCCRNEEDLKVLARVLVDLTLLLIPLAAVEGLSDFRFHSWLLGVHPFTFDGIDRYLGYRPQLFFEHGNQYGLWVAGAALAALWLYLSEGKQARFRYGVSAVLLAMLAIASQSVGAILAMVAAAVALRFVAVFRILGWVWPLLAAFAAIVFALHLSGIVPLRSLAEGTPVLRLVRSGLQAIGRDSLSWRVGQDLKALQSLQEHIWLGSGLWSWFSGNNSRPWGFPLLVIGQFGLVGALLLFSAIASAITVCLHRLRRAASPAHSFILAVVMLAVIDAFLNSFLLYPAIVLCGATLSIRPGTVRAEATAR